MRTPTPTLHDKSDFHLTIHISIQFRAMSLTDERTMNRMRRTPIHGPFLMDLLCFSRTPLNIR